MAKLVLSFLLLAISLNAQDFEKFRNMSLEELLNFKVITATRSLKPLNESPSSIKVFTKEDIKNNQWEYLVDLLNSVDGTITVDAGMYSLSNFRGIPDISGTGNRLLVMINGIVINWRLNGAWHDFNLDIADKVEVIIGPSSALYGADAFQGVVNIITNTDDYSNSNISLSYGSFNNIQGNINTRFKIDDFKFLINAKISDGDGFPTSDRESAPNEYNFYDENAFKKPYSFFLQTSYKNLDIFYSLYHHYDGYNTAGRFKPVSRWNSDFNNIGINYTAEISDNISLSTKLSGSYSVSDPDEFILTLLNDISVKGTMREWSAGLENILKIQFSEKNNLQVGINYEYAEISDFNRMTPETVPSYLPPNMYNNVAGFAQLETKYFKYLYSVIGIRYDYNSLYGGTINPRLAFIYKVSGDFNLRAGYGEAFRAPDVYEVKTSNPVLGLLSNDDLNPEKLRSFEVSGNILLNKNLFIEGLFYYNQIEDNIRSVAFTLNDENFSQYRNQDDASSKGFNLKLVYQYNWLKASTSYNYNVSKTEQEEDLANTNNHILINELQITPDKKISVNIRHFFYGDFFLPETNPYYPELEGFSRVDCSFLYKNIFNSKFDLSLRIDNLFDSDGGFPGARGGVGLVPGRHLFTSRAIYSKIYFNF